MANKGKKNLIPFTERSKDEVRTINAKGGKASGEARRRKRDMKQCLEMLLSLPATELDYEKLREAGVTLIDGNEGEINKQLVLTAAIMNKAINDGDMQAVKVALEILGEGERSRIERERLELEKQKLALEKERKSDTSDVGKLSELIEGLKDDDIHE